VFLWAGQVLTVFGLIYLRILIMPNNKRFWWYIFDTLVLSVFSTLGLILFDLKMMSPELICTLALASGWIQDKNR
jgi:hypothetical protein